MSKHRHNAILFNFGTTLAYVGMAVLFDQAPQRKSILNPLPHLWVLAKLLGVPYDCMEDFWVVYERQPAPALVVGLEETAGYALAKEMLRRK